MADLDERRGRAKTRAQVMKARKERKIKKRKHGFRKMSSKQKRAFRLMQKKAFRGTARRRAVKTRRKTLKRAGLLASHSPEYINSVIDHVAETGSVEEGQQLLNLDPVFTSTTIGGVAMGLNDTILEADGLKECYTDMEIVDETTLCLYFSKEAEGQQKTISGLLEHFGDVELLVSPEDEVDEAGTQSDCYVFSLDVDAADLEADDEDLDESIDEEDLDEEDLDEEDLDEEDFDEEDFDEEDFDDEDLDEEEEQALYEALIDEDEDLDEAEGETLKFLKTHFASRRKFRIFRQLYSSNPFFRKHVKGLLKQAGKKAAIPTLVAAGAAGTAAAAVALIKKAMKKKKAKGGKAAPATA